MNAGKSLKIAMAMQGLSTKDMAALLGCSTVMVSKYQREPHWTTKTVSRISEALKMKASGFVALGE